MLKTQERKFISHSRDDKYPCFNTCYRGLHVLFSPLTIHQVFFPRSVNTIAHVVHDF